MVDFQSISADSNSASHIVDYIKNNDKVKNKKKLS